MDCEYVRVKKEIRLKIDRLVIQEVQIEFEFGFFLVPGLGHFRVSALQSYTNKIANLISRFDFNLRIPPK